ncbi:MAG: hypothetical protein WDZ30_08025 [Cellvibrionaceae bacterium]
MRLDMEQQLADLRSVMVELLPVVGAALCIFAVLLVLGPLTYGLSGYGLSGSGFAGNGLVAIDALGANFVESGR